MHTIGKHQTVNIGRGRDDMKEQLVGLWFVALVVFSAGAAVIGSPAPAAVAPPEASTETPLTVLA